jgi:hypothetical protein
MLTNLFKREEKTTGFTPKTTFRNDVLQTYAEFGIQTESEARYVDSKIMDIAECAAGLGMLTAAASAVIGATAAAVTMTVNSINNNKHKNEEKFKIMDYRIDAITAGKTVDEINKDCRIVKGKNPETLSDKMKAAAAAAKARLEAAAAAKGEGAKK